MINVSLPPKRLTNYDKFVNKSTINTIKQHATRLKAKRVVEINSTSEGGGVAEMLKSYIPLLADVGIEAYWRVLMPDRKFFKITKTIHNCLQGICPMPLDDELKYYYDYLAKQAKHIPPADLYVLHDPQTLGLIDYLPEDVPVIWRCHIDLTSSDQVTKQWLLKQYKRISKVIFSLDNYALGTNKDKIAIITPAIDPLIEKNRELNKAQITQSLAEFNIDLNKPFITQISRYDQFKDPIGVLDMYSIAKHEIEDLGCVLMGNYATDDPEGYPYFQKLRAKISDIKLPDIRLITKDDNTLVNSLQTQANVVLQNSSREGFGLTVTEAMWKGNLVMARPVGGIALQVIHGKTGLYLSDNMRDNVAQLVDVIRHPDKYKQIRKNAKAHVRSHFLITRMLLDHLKLYDEVIN